MSADSLQQRRRYHEARLSPGFGDTCACRGIDKGELFKRLVRVRQAFAQERGKA